VPSASMGVEKEEGRGGAVLSSWISGSNLSFEPEGQLRAKDRVQGSGSRHLHHWNPLTAGDL